ELSSALERGLPDVARVNDDHTSLGTVDEVGHPVRKRGLRSQRLRGARRAVGACAAVNEEMVRGDLQLAPALVSEVGDDGLYHPVVRRVLRSPKLGVEHPRRTPRKPRLVLAGREDARFLAPPMLV